MKQAITVAVLIDLFPKGKLRNRIRSTVLQFKPDVMRLPAQTLADSLDQRLSQFDAPCYANSASTYRYNVRSLIRWGVAERLIKIAPPPKEFGYPTFQQFLGNYEKHSTVPRTVWNHFLHYVSSHQIECFKIERGHLDEFRQWLSSHVKNYKRQWNFFSQRWNELAEAGLVPDISTATYPTRKRARYAISLEDLPDTFQEEFQAARQLLTDGGLLDRKGKCLFSPSTIALRESTLLRYLGWLRDQGHDLVAHVSPADWIQDDLIDAYLKATNTEGDGLADMGRYQHTILLNMEQHMRHGFLRPDKVELLRNKREYYDKRFHARRESRKDVVPLNSVYSLITGLLEQANSPAQPVSTLTRALAIRDAVAILLLAMFAYRRAIVTKLHLGSTLCRVTENGITRYLVLVPKKLTKPRIREGYYEVPEHFTWLLDFYCCTIRPYLLGKQPDCGNLLLEEAGGALSGASVYRIMVERSMEVLNIRVNPHMLRKSLATEWFEHNPHDLLTLSLVMDCSIPTLERSYALNRTKAALDKFDTNIRRQLATGKPDAAPPPWYDQSDPRPAPPSSPGGLS